MPNTTEIFENTLLKLIVRQGPDSDRKNVKFSSGELAYSTDTKKLYVGDGSTDGGILVGNSFSGSTSDITTLAPASIGNLAFDSDNFKLYRLESNDGSNLSDWEEIGGVYRAGDNTISISSDNQISVGLLSSSNIDPSAVKFPIYLDGTNKISLSSNITVDQILPRNSTHVTLFSALSVNGLKYQFPSSYSTGDFLRIADSDGNLIFDTIPLSSISTNTITVNFPLTASVNGIDATGTAFNPLTGNVIIGTSPTLSAYNLWARYDSYNNTVAANRGISSITRTNQGKYTATFDFTLPIENPYASVQIYGPFSKQYMARVVEVSDTQCLVEIESTIEPGLSIDADFSLKIET